MPNDAKLGLVFGVILVVLVAILFFRKEPTVPVAAETAVASNAPTPMPGPKQRPPRKHRVQEGETLAGLAQLYLNDDSRTADIRRANPGSIPDNGELTVGQELIIPEAPEGK